MSDKKIEFWQTSYFWKPVIISTCIILLAVSVVRVFVLVNSARHKEDDLRFDFFLFKAATGQKVEEKNAWPKYVWAVRSGLYLKDEIKKGKSLDSIVKNIQNLRADIVSRERNQRENYKDFLRTGYKIPEPMIHLSSEDRWKKIEESKEDAGLLKEILSGAEYKKVDPDYSLNFFSLEFFVILGIFTQFASFIIGIINFAGENRSYRYRDKLRESNLNIGAYVTFIVFSPGALPIIAIMLVFIGKHQILIYFAEKNERKYRIPKATETDTKSQVELLSNLEKRIHRNSGA